ncbi:hypothetical protein Q3G72_013557 [Acer saccharum]|nr:hypothetical protein Q3G72_013557 [Acer saccharum]
MSSCSSATGVLKANFVESAHDKQSFERSHVLSRLENRINNYHEFCWAWWFRRTRSWLRGVVSSSGKRETMRESMLAIVLLLMVEIQNITKHTCLFVLVGPKKGGNGGTLGIQVLGSNGLKAGGGGGDNKGTLGIQVLGSNGLNAGGGFGNGKGSLGTGES